MAKFVFPSEEDCTIDLFDNETKLGSVDIVDIVNILNEAIEIKKQQKDRDTWDIYIELFETIHGIKLPNKAIAISVYDKATDMLSDLKKKSNQSQQQSNTTT